MKTTAAMIDFGTNKIVTVVLGIFREKVLLGFQTVELVFLIGGNPAICGDIHMIPPLFLLPLIMTWIWEFVKSVIVFQKNSE